MIRGLAQGVGHSPVCQILLQMMSNISVMASPPAWTMMKCCPLQPTCLPSVILLQLQLLPAG